MKTGLPDLTAPTDQQSSFGMSRRSFVGSSSILLSCLVAGQTLLMTPRQAQAAQVPMSQLSDLEARTLGAVAEAIVPGALEAGVVQFVDKQLGQALEESLLMIKYLGVPAPFDGFYRSGLKALSELSERSYEKSWDQLSANETATLINRVATNDVGDWQAAPAPFVFFVVRSDACDVVYGTEQGFNRIDMPYMAHITPEHNWRG